MKRGPNFTGALLGDRLRLALAMVLLGIVQLGFAVTSFSLCRRVLMNTAAFVSPITPGTPTPSRVAEAVKAADSTLPADRTCLMRSLTAETMLALYGYEVDHRIGVSRDDGSFEAHSWIEHGGEILIGDLEGLSRFEPFPPLMGMTRL